MTLGHFEQNQAGRIVLTMFVKSRNWAYLTLI
jgi:hypothetical protein